jgi:hypothetical protein
MKSKVFFIAVNDGDDIPLRQQKLKTLLAISQLFDFIRPGTCAAVKLHFGEEGNTGYVRPEYVRRVCEDIRRRQARPLVSDTNTLYRGRRVVAADHLKLAHEHGFTDEATCAEVVIADEKEKGGVVEIELNGQYVAKAKIASLFVRADSLIGLAHFKGHLMTGFGGALKNIGMGCAARDGKLFQHGDVSPIVIADNCVGCGACEAVCPVKAITIVDRKSRINGTQCIGCASCIAACAYHAIDVDWERGKDTIQERMIEYAQAALVGKEHTRAFINFAIKITTECDCLAKDDPKISPDVGFFASHDPVALDKATLDSVVAACGRDIFAEVHPKRNAMKQLLCAEKLKLGTIEYELTEV